MFKRKRFLISFEEAVTLEERHYGGNITYHMKEYVFGNPFTCVHQIVNIRETLVMYEKPVPGRVKLYYRRYHTYIDEWGTLDIDHTECGTILSIKPNNEEQAEVVEHFEERYRTYMKKWRTPDTSITPCKSKMWMKMAFDCHTWEVDHNVISYMRYCYEEAQDEYSSDDVEIKNNPSSPISEEEYDKRYKAAFGVSP